MSRRIRTLACSAAPFLRASGAPIPRTLRPRPGGATDDAVAPRSEFEAVSKTALGAAHPLNMRVSVGALGRPSVVVSMRTEKA